MKTVTASRPLFSGQKPGDVVLVGLGGSLSWVQVETDTSANLRPQEWLDGFRAEGKRLEHLSLPARLAVDRTRSVRRISEAVYGLNEAIVTNLTETFEAVRQSLRELPEAWNA